MFKGTNPDIDIRMKKMMKKAFEILVRSGRTAVRTISKYSKVLWFESRENFVERKKFFNYWPAVVAKLVQQSSNYPEFKGLTRCCWQQEKIVERIKFMEYWL